MLSEKHVDILSGILSDIESDLLSDILTAILSEKNMLTFYLAVSLAFYVTYILTF